VVLWNKVYKSDNTFFGEEPSNFALLCFNHIKKVLELGAGHGRDSIFFASNGIEVEALDYSAIAVIADIVIALDYSAVADIVIAL
jgi:hypothetical protein